MAQVSLLDVLSCVPTCTVVHTRDGILSSLTSSNTTYRVKGITDDIQKYMLGQRKSGLKTKAFVRKTLKSMGRPAAVTIPKDTMVKGNCAFFQFQRFIVSNPSEDELYDFMLTMGFAEKLKPFLMSFCKSVLGTKCLGRRKGIWHKMKIPQVLGTSVDSQLKALFNGEVISVGNVAKNVVRTLKALGIVRVAGGTHVANVHNEHPGCRTCTAIQADHGMFTEIDFWGYDSEHKQVCLFEYKMSTTSVLTEDTYNRYNFQLWLSTVMFSMTYPQLSQCTRSYLVVYHAGTQAIDIFPCVKPKVSNKTKTFFPFLSSICLARLRSYAKHSVRQKMNHFSKPIASDTIDMCLSRRYYNCFDSQTVVIPQNE